MKWRIAEKKMQFVKNTMIKPVTNIARKVLVQHPPTNNIRTYRSASQHTRTGSKCLLFMEQSNIFDNLKIFLVQYFRLTEGPGRRLC